MLRYSPIAGEDEVCDAPADIIEGSEYTLAAVGPGGANEVVTFARVQCVVGHWYVEEIDSVRLEVDDG